MCTRGKGSDFLNITMATGWDLKGRQRGGWLRRRPACQQGQWPRRQDGRQSSELEVEMGRNRQIQKTEKEESRGWRWRCERGNRRR